MIVFPMAGLSSRFFKEGYQVPKYMLDLNGISIFEWAVTSFKNYFSDDLFLFVLFDQHNTLSFIEEKIKLMGIRNYQIICLEKMTLGQADTVYQGIKGFLTDEEMYIFNIDSRLEKFRKNDELLNVDGYLEVFQGEGEHWSFIEPSINNLVLRTTEKDRISNYCSNGLYYFKSIFLYKEIFEENINKLTKNELYIAPLYNEYIKLGKTIKYKLVNYNDISFCGTPKEYQETKIRIQSK
jgi:dTDP-glucose pyrophosphorylase